MFHITTCQNLPNRKHYLLVVIFAALMHAGLSQVSITGPSCIILGQQPSYNYTISAQWNNNTSMTWQVTGGIITNNGGTSISGTPYPNISIAWSTSGTVTLNTSIGNASLNVTVAAALNPGTIINSSQSVNYGVTPTTLSCPLAIGGYCTPTYTYQWQLSLDNITFSDISGATSQNLSFTTGLTQTTYYRRKVTETHGPTTAYSNTATVIVYPQLVGGSISPSSQTINYNSIPSTLTLSGVSGGTNSYTYQWQSSANGSSYGNITGATGTSYTPPALTSTLYYRVQVTSNGGTVSSATAIVTVNPQVLPGTIAPGAISITTGTSPGAITNLSFPSGGACGGSYSYQWQSSTDGVNFSSIGGASSSSYTPGNLSANTWYRRQVTCGTDIEYSNVCKVSIVTGSPDMGFVKARDIVKPGVTTMTAAAALSARTDVAQQTQYFDGLGRPVELVAMQESPLLKDMVSSNVYDNLGREAVTYLPYTATTTDGNFKPTMLADQYSFNNTQIPGETFYYGQQVFEPSPLNRVTATMAPGVSWTGSARGSTIQYAINTVSDSVRYWTISSSAGSLPTSTAVYSPGKLYKTVRTDEQGHQTIEYKDLQGRVVLKKVQLLNTPGTAHVGWLCTYYIYDDMNTLRFVIQPRAVELINSNWTLTTAIANELCFRYEYDARKRMIIKKIPGAGEVWMVYDARDRLALTQDSNLRASHQWMVTRYDSENRPDSTVLITDNTNYNNRSYHENLASTSIYYPNLSSYTNELLTQTYYDDYIWVSGTGTSLTSTIDNTYTGNATYFNTSYNTSPVYAQQIIPYYITRGMSTGSKTKVIGTASQFLYSVSFYDDRGRTVQAQAINYTGGKDVVSMQYDFSGRVIRTLQQQTKSGTNAQTHKVLTKNNYDASGRLLTLYKNIDDAGSDQLIATNTYNELGQLSTKAEGNSIETLTYAYNVRGWLTSINKNYLSSGGSNYFGMELAYDKTTAAVSSTSYTTPLYNGNITGTIWKTKGDAVNRKYDFTYDNVDRLTGANFNQNSTGTSWSNSLIDFTVNNLTYDANGNIVSMNQKGFKVNSSPLIDQLTYTYQTNSNKLAKVTDAADPSTKLGDFHDGSNGSTDDYSYDGNGNLNLDNNKAISAITYNFLNLPNVVTVTNKGTISYTYDAVGNKLVKTTVEGPKTTTTLYLNNFLYQNDTLQFIGHEEGRTRWAFHKYLNGTSAYGFEYDYFLKDHLGNVRMVLTQQKDTAQYMATMEAAYRTTENQLFYNIPQSNYSRALVSGYPADNTTNPNDSLMKLNGSGQKIGAAIVLKVMSGDVVDVAVKSYYATQTGGGTTSSVTDVLNSFANGIVTLASGSKGSLADLNNQTTSPLFNAINSFAATNNPTISGKPRAYLNWILLDDQLQYVSSYPQSGAVAVGNTATGTLNTLGYTGIPITKNGYLYIYVNNETQNWDVFFDNLSIQHRPGPITEETHYYPFGLIIAGISSKALNFGGLENKCKFNNGSELQSKEFTDLSGLELYTTNYRLYDPQIGRFWQIDPCANISGDLSPYVFASNNPILRNDPFGLRDTIVNGESMQRDKDGPEVIITARKKGPSNLLVHLNERRNNDVDRTQVFHPIIGGLALSGTTYISSEIANKGFAQPPYPNGTYVRQFRTTVKEVFVRLSSSAKGVQGQWLVKASSIRGMTAQQIQQNLALPETPTQTGEVIVPEGTLLRAGPVGANAFGPGNLGITQYQLMEPIPSSCFAEPVPIVAPTPVPGRVPGRMPVDEFVDPVDPLDPIDPVETIEL